MFDIPHPYYNPVKALIQRTYDAHALGSAPWGAVQKEAGVACYYEKNCAVGLSIEDTDLKAEMDKQNSPGIRDILEGDADHWVTRAVRRELFETSEEPPEEVCALLKHVQLSHDKAARLDNRAYYRGRLDLLCDLYGVLITGRL